MFKTFLETMMFGDISHIDEISLKKLIDAAFQRKEIPQPFLTLKGSVNVVEHFEKLVDKYGEDIIINYYLPHAS
jgi:hypothetical protein